jgi:HEAT repeat protein
MLQGLRDADSEVRLAAARSVLPSATDEDIADIYEIALGNNLLTRVVLTEDLRRHALTLSVGPVRKALRSENLPRVRAAMQMLVAWERATPLEDIREFLDHRDRGIRVLAFKLVSLLPANFETRLALIRGLNDSDAEIRTLAVISAGRLKMAETIPELARCMRDGDMALARHAAESIGGMPNGDATLVELAAGNEPQTAAAASEVLARLRSKP